MEKPLLVLVKRGDYHSKMAAIIKDLPTLVKFYDHIFKRLHKICATPVFPELRTMRRHRGKRAIVSSLP